MRGDLSLYAQPTGLLIEQAREGPRGGAQLPRVVVDHVEVSLDAEPAQAPSVQPPRGRPFLADEHRSFSEPRRREPTLSQPRMARQGDQHELVDESRSDTSLSWQQPVSADDPEIDLVV